MLKASTCSVAISSRVKQRSLNFLDSEDVVMKRSPINWLSTDLMSFDLECSCTVFFDILLDSFKLKVVRKAQEAEKRQGDDDIQ